MDAVLEKRPFRYLKSPFWALISFCEVTAYADRKIRVSETLFIWTWIPLLILIRCAIIINSGDHSSSNVSLGGPSVKHEGLQPSSRVWQKVCKRAGHHYIQCHLRIDLLPRTDLQPGLVKLPNAWKLLDKSPCVIPYDSWKCFGDGGMKGITQTSKDLKEVDVDKQYQLCYPTSMGFPEWACSCVAQLPTVLVITAIT